MKRKGGSRRGAPMLSVAASLRSRSSRTSAKLAKSGGDGDGDRSSSQTRSTRKTTGSGGGFFGDEELEVDEEEQELQDGRHSMSSFATTDDRCVRACVCVFPSRLNPRGSATTHTNRTLESF